MCTGLRVQLPNHNSGTWYELGDGTWGRGGGGRGGPFLSNFFTI